jgi:hypothetical protein
LNERPGGIIMAPAPAAKTPTDDTFIAVACGRLETKERNGLECDYESLRVREERERRERDGVVVVVVVVAVAVEEQEEVAAVAYA